MISVELLTPLHPLACAGARKTIPSPDGFGPVICASDPVIKWYARPDSLLSHGPSLALERTLSLSHFLTQRSTRTKTSLATQVPSLCCHTAHQPFTTSVLVQSTPLHSSPNLISAQDMPDSSSPFSPPLPIIDITPYLPSSSSSSSSPAFTERAKVAQSLHQACRDLGFFCLRISSFLDPGECSEILDLGREFFRWPQEEKDAIGLEKSDGCRGMSPSPLPVCKPFNSGRLMLSAQGIRSCIRISRRAKRITTKASTSTLLPHTLPLTRPRMRVGMAMGRGS